jgi:histidine triad (HIT) family protein
VASIFSKIISGEIPAYKVAENDQFLAFLDVFPIARGHTLVIPKKETDYILDIDDETYKDLWLFAKQVGKKVDKAMPCERVGIAVIGLEVRHAHIHLVPINGIGDINFNNPKLKLSESEMKEISSSISNA